MGRSPIVATLMHDNVNDGRAGSAARTTFGFGCPHMWVAAWDAEGAGTACALRTLNCMYLGGGG